VSESQPVPLLDAAGLRIALVYSTYNAEVTDGLLAGAKDWLEEAGAAYDVAAVLGSFELPVVARQAAMSGYDAVVAIGAVIEGATDHYEHVAHRTSEGLMQVALDTGVPVGFGVLTARSQGEALERSAAGLENKGREAAAAAVQAVHAGRLLQSNSRPVEANAMPGVD